MAISLVGATGNAGNFAAYPSGLLSGDLLILILGSYSGDTMATPTGWTKRLERAAGSGEAQCTVFTRTATTGLSGTLGGPTGGVALAMIALRGADTTTPFDLTSLMTPTGYVLTHSWSSITTGDPCWVLWTDVIVGATTGTTTTVSGGNVLVNAKGSFSGVFVARTVQTTEGTAAPLGSIAMPTYMSGLTAALPVRAAGTPLPRPIVAVTGTARAPYGTPVTGSAAVTSAALGATVSGYQWTVAGPGPAPTLTGGNTANLSYLPRAAGTPGYGGAPASFVATCTATDSNGRTGSASFTTLVRATTLTRLGGRWVPVAERVRVGGVFH